MTVAVRDPVRLLRFAGVGIVSTVLYGLLASWLAADGRLASAVASLLAYAIAGVFSYFAHRRITFRSNLPHSKASARFVAFAIWGYATALLAPLLLTDVAGLPAAVSIAFVSISVPALNFVLMQRLVFAEERRSRSGRSIP